MLGDDEDNASRDLPERAHPGAPRGAVVVHERGRGYGAYEWYGDEVQDENAIDLQKYLRILIKHWVIIASVVVLAVAVGVTQTMLTTKMYTASTTIQIDREAARVGDINAANTVASADTLNSEEFFQTQHNLLKSRALAQRTVDTMGLASDPALLSALGIGEPGPDGRRPSASQIRNSMVGYVQGNLGVLPVGRSRLVRLTFESPNPQASAQIANAIAENYIAWNLERRLNASSYARDFLQDRIATEKERLEATQRQLADYATQQGIISIASPSSTEGGQTGANQTLVGSSLLTNNSALDAARSARIRAEQRYNQAMSAGASAREVLEDPTIGTMRQELAQIQGEYREKSAIFQPQEENMRALQGRIAQLESLIETEVDGVLESLRAEYLAARGEEQELAAQVSNLKGNFLDQNSRSIEYDILQREVATSSQQYDGLLQQYKTVSVAGAIDNNNISQVDPALPPGGASRPQPVKNVTTAALLGLLLGIGLAFLREYLDESIRAPEDVEKKLGLPLLGTVPKLERGLAPIDALQDIRSSFSESYYSIRTALQFSTDEGVPSSLLVTSARPSEGKSTSALAIAHNFARLGLRVLLIDGDLRNPSLHRTMGSENSAGLSNFLTGGAPLSVLTQPTETPGLFFIPCGPLPPNPAELLAGSRVDLLLKEARVNHDVIVIDGPPIMGLADAPLLASSVAGTMLVIEAGGTGRNLARVALRRLNVGAPRVLGVVLTKFDAKKSSYGYGYGYGYAYDYAYGSKPQLKSGN